MCGAAWAFAAATALSAGASIYSAEQKAETRAAVAEYNARLQQIQAAQIEEQGVAKQNALLQQASDKIARQQAQAAAGGVRVGSGGVFQLQEGVRYIAQQDVLQIQENYNERAQSVRLGAQLTRMQGQAAANNILLTGYLQAGQTIAGAFTGSTTNILKMGGGKTQGYPGSGGGGGG